MNADAARLRVLPRVPFHRTAVSPAAYEAVRRTLMDAALAGGGRSTDACHALLRRTVPGGRPFLTHSCTAALDMAALVLDLQPGDEVVMPSWTFASTANAVALRGATPVFVDVRADTLNIDPELARAAITSRTRAVTCVHYAGVAGDMDALQAITQAAGVALVEDAAQAYCATWRGRPLGSFGDMAAFSFHGTKNVSSGEAGALIINRPELSAAAEIAWEKGTSRLSFQRGEIDRYEWIGLGSSFLPSELTAAFLAAQLQAAGEFTQARLTAWNRYAELLAVPAAEHGLTLPQAPPDAGHNGHIYAVRLPAPLRDGVMTRLNARGVEARTHYAPLHSAPAGRRYGRVHGPMTVTDAAAASLLRLPIDSLITPEEQAWVVEALVEAVEAER